MCVWAVRGWVMFICLYMYLRGRKFGGFGKKYVLINVEHEVRETSQNTDLDMREMLGLDKALQRVQGELTNNLGKLTSINEHVEHEEQKLKYIKNDPSYRDEQRREVETRLERLKEEHSARLELVSQKKRELQSR